MPDAARPGMSARRLLLPPKWRPNRPVPPEPMLADADADGTQVDVYGDTAGEGTDGGLVGGGSSGPASRAGPPSCVQGPTATGRGCQTQPACILRWPYSFPARMDGYSPMVPVLT